MKPWRPKNWPMNPCENCEKKVEDRFGLFCNLSCGIGPAHENFEAGADAMFDELRREGNGRGGRVENDPIRGTGTWLFMPDEEEV